MVIDFFTRNPTDRPLKPGERALLDALTDYVVPAIRGLKSAPMSDPEREYLKGLETLEAYLKKQLRMK